MAQRFIVKKRFQNRVQKVFTYLSEEWNIEVASDFLSKLDVKMNAVVRNPAIGSMAHTYNNLRSLSVTKHNRLFYRIEREVIVFVMLSDTRKRRYRR